mgnify:CR=1 FL=1
MKERVSPNGGALLFWDKSGEDLYSLQKSTNISRGMIFRYTERPFRQNSRISLPLTRFRQIMTRFSLEPVSTTGRPREAL